MASSTASVVGDSPTRFRYRQHNAMIWGEYVGDTVAIGRFVGQRDGDHISVEFVHAHALTGEITIGSARSQIQSDAFGRLRLVEDFRKDDVDHYSVCVQSDSAGDWTTTIPGGPRAAMHGPSVDGLVFVLESSTASTVDPDAPSRFRFREQCGVMWGEYEGDTVTEGHSIGARDGDVLRETFLHELQATGAICGGHSTSRIGKRVDGRLELVEDFVLDGVPGRSVCVEIVG